MTLVDLHTHTNESDGWLTPAELLDHAAKAGVELLSITDHDTIAGYRNLDLSSKQLPQLVAGVEFSTQWRRTGVHILGLNVNLASDAIHTATTYQRNARQLRGQQIAEGLAKIGVPDPLTGALAIAQGGAIGRPHFARYMVECGFVKDISQAFKKYLGTGKVGDVQQHWASLEQIIDWIRDAGGTTVVAHPGKYGLSRTKRLALIEDFQRLGGQGLEIISGQQDPTLTQSLAATVAAKGLLASCGSDFHRLGQPWARLGMSLRLPAQCRPIWDSW